MQNRESAVRSRQKKKENSKLLESELEFVRNENFRLHLENRNLQNEKSFLIDQIKFMQNLIKNNNFFKTTTATTISIHKDSDIENNLSPEKSEENPSQRKIELNGGRQRPFGKLFSVFIICLLSIIYISVPGDSVGQGIKFSNGSTITLNEAHDKKTKKQTFLTVLIQNISNLIYFFTVLFIFWCLTTAIYYCWRFYVSNIRRRQLYKNL